MERSFGHLFWRYRLLRWLPFNVYRLFPGYAFLLLVWLIAVVAAIASFVYYRKKRKPWYVVSCLVVNVCGLLFSVPVLTLLLIVAVSYR